MTTDSELIQKRQEAREEILALKEQVPLARILNRLGLAFKRNSPGYWLSNIIILNLIFLGSWGIVGLVFNEFERPSIVTTGALVAIEIVTLSSVIAHATSQTILDDTANQIVVKINNGDDLSKLSLWLKRSWSMKNVLSIVVPIALFWAFMSVENMSFFSRHFAGFGISLIALLGGILMGMVVYVYLWAGLLMSNLKVYEYEMNVFSPADSEIISDIFDVAMKGIYILAGWGAFATLINTSNLVDQLSKVRLSLPILAIGWILILVQFMLTRSTLGAITNRTKWKTLNRIRDKINAIEADGDLSDKNTAERLLRLADIHKQIMLSNTKTFDLKSVTTLFSQLMLPLLGLLLGNLDKVLDLLTK